MDILQPHHRDIPEQEDEDKEDQTSKNQQSDKESLLRLRIQMSLHCGMRIAECGMKKVNPKSLPTGRQAQSEIQNFRY